MNIEQLTICSDVLGKMAESFNAMPSDQKDAVQAALICTMAQSYVVEFAKHMSDGLEPFDAMEATVKGSMEIPATASGSALVLGILASQPKPKPE